jgi:hypothetical protein
MKEKHGEAACEELREFARSVRAVVIGDFINCQRKQQQIIEKWWKEKINARGQGAVRADAASRRRG